MTTHRPIRRKCEICQKDFAAVDVMPAALVRPAVTELILGVRAEQKSLESVATPLTAIQQQVGPSK